MKLKRSLLAAATLVVAAAGVQPAAAIKQGDWLVRGRLAAVVPLDDSGVVNVGGAPLAGSGVEVDTGFTLDIDFTYMFTNNIGAELLLDVTSKHDIDSTGTLAGVAPGTILTARALPPALILQYHFMPQQTFKPYLGVGLNYTKFIDAKPTDNGRATLGLSGVDLDDSLGFVLQVGADYQINDRWYLNADLKYIDMDTTATANSALGPIKVDVDVNPLVIGIGVGYRF
ncbi:MAG: OmpW family protein [Gammaproteobacteria bacterium]|nr:OmpW family protein [Gammaproteobacteria bacterium]